MFVTDIQHKIEKTAIVILKVYEENQIPAIIFFESLNNISAQNLKEEKKYKDIIIS